jgi:hypothetical protein
MQLDVNLSSKWLNCAGKKIKNQIIIFKKLIISIHSDL